MSSPIELRLFYPRMQMSDLKMGMPYLRAPDGEFYLNPVLQYRYKMKVKTPTSIELEWSEWIDVANEHEGKPLPVNLT